MTSRDEQAAAGVRRAVRTAIAAGLEPHEALAITRELTEAYEPYDDPALIASEDLASGFNN